MSDYPDGSTLNEAISGNWHRLEQGIRKGTFLIELSDMILLNVHVSSKNVDLLVKENDVFRYMGDFSFEGLEQSKKFMFHSLGIDHVHFNNQNIRIDNPENTMSTVFVKLNSDKKIEELNKLKGL
ncbi:hypothetical protein MHB54_00665 [Paenibacillus sp. FSL M7-0802]|uniref:hypothetical protein n=1 Tax=Paenibacillus sp. FSL M7-0802 TaxID=2921536 RepID=UPI0030F574C6